MSVQEHSDLLSKVQLEWNKAEAAIKAAEMTSHDVVVPSINELRYAGRKLVDALELLSTQADREQVETLLREAVFNCQLARYDAIDAVTAVIALNADLLIENVGYNSLLSYYPNFSGFLKKIQQIRERIAASREDRSQRSTIYSAIEITDLPELINEYERVRSLEPVLKGVERKRRKELLISRITALGGLIFGLLGMISAIFFH